MNAIINSKIVLILVGLSVSNILFAQNFKATYLISIQTDSTNLTSVRQERAFLFTENNEQSFYTTENFFKKDSILRLVNSGKVSAYEVMSDKSNLALTKFDQFIQKDTQSNITVYENLSRDTYRYDITHALSWNVSDTTAKINDYDCIKATTHFAGRNFEAWFTKDIPISAGPYIFCGLPGLIIKISDTKSYYTFELIGFESFKGGIVTTISKDPDKVISTDRKTVFKIREEKRLDPIGSFDRSYGATSIVSPEDREKMKKRVAANNNPLELSLD